MSLADDALGPDVFARHVARLERGLLASYSVPGPLLAPPPPPGRVADGLLLDELRHLARSLREKQDAAVEAAARAGLRLELGPVTVVTLAGDNPNVMRLLAEQTARIVGLA